MDIIPAFLEAGLKKGNAVRVHASGSHGKTRQYKFEFEAKGVTQRFDLMVSNNGAGKRRVYFTAAPPVQPDGLSVQPPIPDKSFDYPIFNHEITAINSRPDGRNGRIARSEARPVDVAAGIMPVFFGEIVPPVVLQQFVPTIANAPNLEAINGIVKNIREQLTHEIVQYRGFFQVNRDTILDALVNLSREGNINSENIKEVLNGLGLDQFQIAKLDIQGQKNLIDGIVKVLEQMHGEVAKIEPVVPETETTNWNEQDAAMASRVVALSAKVKQQTVIEIEIPKELAGLDDEHQRSELRALAEAVNSSLLVVGGLSVRVVAPDTRVVKNWTQVYNLLRTKGDQRFNLTSRMTIVNQKSAVNMRSVGARAALIISPEPNSVDAPNADILDSANFASGDTVNYSSPQKGILAQFFAAGVSALTNQTVEGISKKDNRLQISSPQILNRVFGLVLNMMAQKARELALARAA